jgi:MYXO-CTERM domain-containing protein
MRPRSRHSLALLSGSAALLALFVATPAHADNLSVAVPCEDDVSTCAVASIGYALKDSLPIEWGFDTGWVPPGSPLQVHLLAGLYANTSVSLSGQFATQWPEAFLLTAPGKENGGRLQFHYGLEVVAEAMVQISVLGQSFSWTGPIPYVPQVDFQVDADELFDTWAYAPGHSASGTSDLQKLAAVSIGDIIGSSIPGIDGGFELDAQVELSATYITDRIVVRTLDGLDVPGGALVAADGETNTPALGGPFIELDVFPEGHVDYDGTVHLIPAFYVSLLGQNWNIPVADIPIPFSTAQDWVFDPVRVHVPLPDIAVPTTEIDFGEVAVGDQLLRAFDLQNAGEADVYAAYLVSDAEAFGFVEGGVVIAPLEEATGLVRFSPTRGGPFEAFVTVASNDPDSPHVAFLVHGVGVPLESAATPVPEPSIGEDGTCGCRVPGTSDTGSARGAVALVALAFAGTARRRARTATARRDAPK